MENEVFLTQAGYDENARKLDMLRAITRHEVAQKIKTAREFGDLSENAEYDAAREEQAQVEGEIKRLEALLKFAKIIDENAGTDVVSPGCSVVLYDLDFKEEEEFKIVGVAEANVANNWISNASPIGQAVLGKKVGETFEVKIPAGVIKFKVVKIFR